MLRSAAASNRWITAVSGSIFSKEIPYLVYLPHVVTVTELMEEYGIALDKAFRARCSAKEALDEAAARYEKTVERQKAIEARAKRLK